MLRRVFEVDAVSAVSPLVPESLRPSAPWRPGRHAREDQPQRERKTANGNQQVKCGRETAQNVKL